MRTKSKQNIIICIILYAIPIAIFFLTVLMDIIIFLYLQNSVSIELWIMNNLVSIFGIVVAVWVGINITNIIDQRVLDKTQIDLEEIKNVIVDTSNSLREKLIKLYQEEKEVTINHYFAGQLEKINKEVYGIEVYEKLLQEEQIYNKIRMQIRTRRDLEGDQLIYLYKEYENIMGKLRNSVDSYNNVDGGKIINQIINIRVMEIRFLMGYRTSNPEYFQQAIEYYNSSDMIINGYKIQNLRENKEETRILSIDSETLEVLAYICNFIGESYSKLIEYENRKNDNDKLEDSCYKELCDNAANLLEKAVRYSEMAKRPRETYYRNYGCAIERIHKNEPTYLKYKEALDQYKSAFKLDNGNPKIYQVITAVCNNILICADGKEDIKEEDIEKIFKEFNAIQELYVKIFPLDIIAYRMSILYYLRLYQYKGGKKKMIKKKVKQKLSYIKILDEDYEHDWIRQEITDSLKIKV